MSTGTPQQCKKGTKLKLYYNTGTDAAQVWVLHEGMVEDLTLGETEEENEVNDRREDREVKEYSEGEVEVSITGTQLTDPEYEGWQFLNSMRSGGSPGDVMCLTDTMDIVGAYGWRGHMRNFDRTFNGPRQGNQTNAVSLKPAAQCTADHVGVRPVKIATADTVTDFDPTVWEASS